MEVNDLWTPLPFHVTEESNLAALGLSGWRGVLEVLKPRKAIQARESLFRKTCFERISIASQDPGIRTPLCIDLGDRILIVGKTLLPMLERNFLSKARKLQSKVDLVKNRLKKSGLTENDRRMLELRISHAQDERLVTLHKFKVKRQASFRNLARYVNSVADYIIAPKLAVKQLIKKDGKNFNYKLQHSAPISLYNTQEQVRTRSFFKTAYFLGDADESCSTSMNRQCLHFTKVGARKVNHCERCRETQRRDEGSSTSVGVFSVAKPNKKKLPKDVLKRCKLIYELYRYVENRALKEARKSNSDSSSDNYTGYQTSDDNQSDPEESFTSQYEETLSDDNYSSESHLSDNSFVQKRKRRRPCCSRLPYCLRYACDFCQKLCNGFLPEKEHIRKRQRLSSNSTLR
jgi:hypothetical protein